MKSFVYSDASSPCMSQEILQFPVHEIVERIQSSCTEYTNIITTVAWLFNNNNKENIFNV